MSLTMREVNFFKTNENLCQVGKCKYVYSVTIKGGTSRDGN